MLFKEIFETKGSKELHFANKDILELLKKTVSRVSRQQVSKVLQQEWKLEPVNNSLAYQTYIYNAVNELVPAHYTGRYYTISRDWLGRKLDESG